MNPNDLTMPESKRVSKPPIKDSGKRCRKCQYNLTGVTESRCPECGESCLEGDVPDRVRLISLKKRIVYADIAAVLIVVLMVVVPRGKSGGLDLPFPTPGEFLWGLLLLAQWVLAFVGGWQALTLLSRDEVDITWLGLALLPLGLAAVMSFLAGRLLDLKGFSGVK